jgi:hypothetical protein
VIFSSCDLPKLENSNFEIPFGRMMLVDTDGTVRDLKLHGFPEGVAFYPHGLSIWEGKWVYVINHAYNRGGERVEVFEIRNEGTIELYYLQSFEFPDNMAGALNDLAVVAPGEFYITHFWPVEQDVNIGKDKSFWSVLEVQIRLMYT